MEIKPINSVNFQRKPNQKEMQVYTESLQKGLKLLNKQVDVIIHNSSAPSSITDNTGIGSLYSRISQKRLIPFLKDHAITGIQQEPNGLRKLGDPSPYAPESSAKNILTIPLEKLASEQYGKILPRSVFSDIVFGRPYGNGVDYDYVNKQYDRALRIAFENFKKGDKLKPEFEEFKARESENLEKAAIYRILDRQYGKNWTEWGGIDQRLYAPRNSAEKRAADVRIKEIKAKNKDEIDFYMFQQMILDIENKESNKLAKETGVKIIGDSPVASPAAEEWVNQDLFLQGKAIGCAPDYFSPDGQRWGFRYYDPKKIFNPDGSLGEAGKALQKKYEDYFASYPGGLRIDHVIGLVDPFIYTTSEKMTPQNSGRLYSTLEYKKMPDEYPDILEKIVLPAARKYGLDKSALICEDLGEPNKPTMEAMKKLDLSGIAVTQFDYRGAETPERNVIMIGSHDNQSFLEFVEDFFKKTKSKHFYTKTRNLAEDIAPKDATQKEIRELEHEIRTDKKKFISASFAELFTSPARRVQIFFTDFWGIPRTYNKPGTTKGNWALRIGNNFEKDYYNAVSKGEAPNLADAVATALRQRGLDKNHKKLMSDLEASARILAEA